MPISHWFDLAYDTPSMMSPDSTLTWLQMWAEREFGVEVAQDTAKVMNTYGMLAGRRKFELVAPSTYSVINYNEAETILGQWKNLTNDAQAIHDKLESSAQAAFFEMVLHPALAGYTVHEIYVLAAMNNIYAQQRRTSANTLAQNVMTAFNTDANITNRYHSLLGGKWNHMMDQTHLGYDYW